METEVNKNSEDNFYDKAIHYWENVAPTVNGMLGGFGYVTQTDIDGSKKFLQKIFQFKNAPEKTYAVDCGAGIGRITEKFLARTFDKVDLVEQNPYFLEKAEFLLRGMHGDKIGKCFAIGLQDFIPEPSKYDVIWIQWVLGHLKDEDFIKFFQRCIGGLRHNGVIIVKENVTSSGLVEEDELDSSVTRPLETVRELLKASGLTCIKESRQANFPRGLYAVHVFALRPKHLEITNKADVDTE